MKRPLLLSTALLAACQQAADAPADEATAAASPAATPSMAETLALAPLQDGDGAVVGEGMSNVGGCSFHDKGGTLLLAVGIPDNYDLAEGAGGPAIGVARVNGQQVKLTADKADAGYVEGGPALSGGGFKLTVLRAEGEGKALDRELVEYAADLVVSDGGGDARTYAPGGWRCGV